MAEMELWQERYQVGPARTAVDEGVAVLVADIGDCDDRWPLFAAAAHQAGVMAVGAIPMRLGADIIGVLDLYSATRRDWPDADVAAAQLLADMATGYLVSHLHPGQHSELADYRSTTSIPAAPTNAFYRDSTGRERGLDTRFGQLRFEPDREGGVDVFGTADDGSDMYVTRLQPAMWLTAYYRVPGSPERSDVIVPDRLR